jgi:phosphoglycerate-specific signal transduction histidine kinase
MQKQSRLKYGKRADSIVKNMLQHSREGSGEHRPADINAIVDESLNLLITEPEQKRQALVSLCNAIWIRPLVWPMSIRKKSREPCSI